MAPPKGIVKNYLRYAHSDTFNIISSSNSNINFVVHQGQEGRFVASGACENVYLWDLRLGEKALVIPQEDHIQVTHLCASPDRIHIAVGYSNGSIGVTNVVTGELKTVFSGHRSAISTLAFDEGGYRLASGSKDTEIVTWDLIAESGLQRFSGHKGEVTAVLFMQKYNVLISSSKDACIKFWDIDTVYCFNTIAAHIKEVWGISLIGEDEYLLAGSDSKDILVWTITNEEKSQQMDDEAKFHVDFSVKKAGAIMRSSDGRLASMVTDNSRRIVTLHGNNPIVESFLFLTTDEAKQKARKRMRKERKAAEGEDKKVNCEVTLMDTVRRLATFKASGNVKSVTTVRGNSELRVAVSLNNNQLDLYTINLSPTDKREEPALLRSIKRYGHQNEVRAVALCSEGLSIVSAGTSSIKLWNRASLQCTRTIKCQQAVSVTFGPSERIALVGLKDGHLLIVDLSAGEIVEDISAHTDELTRVILTFNKFGAITCSADSTVKVWAFDYMKDEETKTGVMSLLHKRTLKVDDRILDIKQSPCGKLLAAALLDSTVKVFFFDTFKFFLSLYGHKLPVTCIDISSDSSLIVSGSADRNVKIWGLDFGDCHKSIFAHDDSVTAIAFVPNTHYFFTAGKDGKLKEWDADNFQKIITLDAHFGGCWNISVTKDFVLTCGLDRSIRLFEKTLSILELQDEQEEERAKGELATGENSIMKLPSTKTISSERKADLLMECLDVIMKYKEDERSTGKPPPVPSIMTAFKAKTPEEYLANVLFNIGSSELGEALLILPLHLVTFMFKQLPPLLSNPAICEIAARSLTLLIKVHLGPILSMDDNLVDFETLKEAADGTIQKHRDMAGVDLYGLKFVQREIEEKEGVALFREASLKHKEKINRKRKKEVVKKSVMIKL